MNLEIHPKDELTSWEELVVLFHESFQERLDQGLNFTCSFFTPEDLERRSEDCVVLVAIDKDCDDRLVGTVSFSKLSRSKAEHLNLAVIPSYKHAGVATQLLKALLDLAFKSGCNYIVSDTAEQAISSVKWHKKNGFYPFSLRSFGSTNYYSIIFRKQLKHHWLWSNPNCCAMHFALSSAINKLYRNSDGSLTKLGKIFFFFRKG